NFAKYVRQQRIDQAALNTALRDDFVKRGLVFNEVDQTAFRAKLPAVYATWKERLGAKCWSLVEAEVGKLGELLFRAHADARPGVTNINSPSAVPQSAPRSCR